MEDKRFQGFSAASRQIFDSVKLIYARKREIFCERVRGYYHGKRAVFRAVYPYRDSAKEKRCEKLSLANPPDME